MSKILVIGCGNVGSVGLHKMAQMPQIFSEIHVVSRTKKKCEAVNDSIVKRTKGKVKLHIHEGNVSDKKFLVSLIKEIQPELLVHWGLPYDNLTVMDVCLETGVKYIDTACYEDPKEYGFSHRLQWAKDKEFKKKGLLAILGSGFDPGVSNIFSAYARDYLFDKIETIDILDCNGGSKDKKIKFAPNFDPEINLRELILPIKFWKNGKWQTRGRLIDDEAAFFEFDFPEAGKFTPYLMYHEEMESLVRNIPGLKRIRFWMTFSPAYLTYLRVLFNVGLTRIDPVAYEGSSVVPIKFLKTILPKGVDFNKTYKGKTNIGNIISGTKNGKKKVIYIYNVCDHRKAFLETGGNAIGYTTAIPTVTAAKLVLQGKWSGAGVKNTEDKSLDSKIFLEELTKVGLPWKIKELKDLPKELKKDY
ncbi:MAG: saccharopine dehydrogenase family protein [Patescibacteria group bacterium]|nr:saccharopine dehydrogenase family protein [Patescibacteria group bacterium]MDD4611032.1 saccharopine dehydrogenase family protein [Patescibacteria group bacterium]